MPRPHLLLVDDDPAVRSSIAFALGTEGFDVHAFANAEAALACERLDDMACLLLDHRLPGVDGLGLLAQLRAGAIASPAIVITSNPSRRLRQRVEEAGATLIEKPLLGNVLALAIRTALALEGDRE
ncbi:MAG: response regulator [Sphingomonas sp.]|uniref:response regulator n=1 Tax=Sphingomonas sp. TaxID=28214 RepID=UPI0022767888|nr:response regulator [Sphingomonas sp.]MCX8474788.1 response regulator [Sphingomonas sp.]